MWFLRLLDRLGVARTFYGRDARYPTPYLTRVYLLPRTRWGQLCLHVFHRGDLDPDPHDHPFDFWTRPLWSAYFEEVMDGYGRLSVRTVLPGRWHHRRAEHTHRVLGPSAGMRDGVPIMATDRRQYTLIWKAPRSQGRREWGFWVKDDRALKARRFVSWKDYVHARQSSEV